MASNGRAAAATRLVVEPAEPPGDFREQLVELLPHLRAYARFLAKNRDLADDIVQDSLVRMLKAEQQLRPNSNLKAWAFTVLRNRFYSHFHRKHLATAPLEEAYGARRAEQEGGLSFRDFHQAFWQLPESHREVLMLIGRSGLSYEDAAKVCGCQIGTIKSRLSRARRDLRRKLES